uniref:NADH-ubiquinone oxidoreductase chain 4 n=1 Tax=Tupiella akineta TaxID=160070 RepID=Q6UVR8_TUPAK|nr:NADH dehydrogenase subunit 4 [Tupiella akineta]AAQ18756.1 NADH dehydrogenase subunit 4 [Tupiella akineta]
MNLFNYSTLGPLAAPVFSNGESSLLLILQLLPLFGALLLFMVPAWQVGFIRLIALNVSLITFLLSLALWVLFDPLTADFQFRSLINFQQEKLDTATTLHSLQGLLDNKALDWNNASIFETVGNLFNFSFSFGIDGISLWLVLLTTFLTPICILVGWALPASLQIKGPHYLKIYCIIFLIIESLLLVVFCVRDLLVFYIFFEAVLIPMFLLIGLFGSQPRNIRAAYKMFLYTLAGSLPMLVGILLIYFQCGSTDWSILSTSYFSPTRQLILWALFFFSFAVKAPLVPFHGWLPETHSNAPTAGSIVLAGILLKLGTYGFLRWSVTLFPLASVYFAPIVYIICLVGVVYVSLITLRQIDVKKLIAYSSVSHMALCLLGMFAFNVQGLEGSLLMMVAHGIVSPGLFLCIGILYDRYKTRVIQYYGGLAMTMPILATSMLILIMGNLSLPILSPSFGAELLIFTGVFLVNRLVAIIAISTMVLTAAYSLFLFSRVFFGNLKTVYISQFSDVSRREFFCLFPFLALSLLLGIFPALVLDTCHVSIAYILVSYN